jgi:alpha-mannosidase
MMMRPNRGPVSLEVAAHHLHGEPIAPTEAICRQFHHFEVGQPWGASWDTTWFRLRGRIPLEWAGLTVVARVHLGGREVVGFSAEGLVYDAGARVIQGLHHHHRSVHITPRAAGGEEVELYVEAAANPIPPWHLAEWPLLEPDYSGQPIYVLRQAELVALDLDEEGLLADLAAINGLAGTAEPARSEELTRLAAEAVEVGQARGDIRTARSLLSPVLATRTTSTHAVTALGHAHIDTAWLWPLRETRRKVARTFANQLRLMERHPEHRFAASQALHYHWIEQDHPELYEQVKMRVAEGRWEPVGAMWVEADTNIPSGESLVRQLVLGKRYFLEHLGVDTDVLWLPDDFGYSAALPQIANQAGVANLVTQKLSWNDTNRFPHTTFWWEGHDGSRLLTHFPPADTYNGDCSARELARCEARHRDRDRSDSSLYLFGYGDGGGGPTSEMLESLRRLSGAEGLPVAELGSAREFFDHLPREGLETWVGELYLEAHRGTYTTHADVKKANRSAESALRAAEIWSAAAGLDRKEELDRAWEALLVHQFHDILPGSSIHWVYQDSARDLSEVIVVAQQVAVEAQRLLVAEGEGLVAFNAGSCSRRELAELPDGELAVVSVPGCGWAPVDRAEPVSWPPVVAGEGFMDNGLLRVEWDENGLISRIRDHERRREVLAEGERGNMFQLHVDQPRAFDAWDVDRSYLEACENIVDLDAGDLVEVGPLRGAVRLERSFGSSRVVQLIRLSAGSRRIDFQTEVDWQERHRFLKVAFPVAVRSARASYEIQHGYVERPTHRNTSWDEARFEVCGHRWADLSETGYGVALLNDCKYGYDVHGHTLRLSLLRGPGFPDPEADRGIHRFTYSLLPHTGDLSDVVSQAEALNVPLSFRAGSGSGQVVDLDRPGVSVEAVKQADRGVGMIVRLCEVLGSRGPATLRFNLPFSSVRRTDILERDVGPAECDGAGVHLQLRPFELVTLRFYPQL